MASAYIAGPMRGYPRFNFDAFDAARDIIRSWGIDPVSPADLDRKAGIDPDNSDGFSESVLRECLKRDIVELIDCDLIVMLHGWEDSAGAVAEYALATAIGIPVIEFHCGNDGTYESLKSKTNAGVTK